MTDHSDLIAELRRHCELDMNPSRTNAMHEAADAIERLTIALHISENAALSSGVSEIAGRSQLSLSEARAAPEILPGGQDCATALSEAREEIERLTVENASLVDAAKAEWSKHGATEIALGQWRARATSAEEGRDEWRRLFWDERRSNAGIIGEREVLRAALEVAKRRFKDIATGAAYQPSIHAGAGVIEIDAALNAPSDMENGPAVLADATNDPASPDLSSLRDGDGTMQPRLSSLRKDAVGPAVSEGDRSHSAPVTSGAEVAVKALEWHKSNMPSWDGDYHTVPTAYTVRLADENGWKWQGLGAHGYASSPEAAQRAVQQYHETRIRSALVSGSREEQ